LTTGMIDGKSSDSTMIPYRRIILQPPGKCVHAVVTEAIEITDYHCRAAICPQAVKWTVFSKQASKRVCHTQEPL